MSIKFPDMQVLMSRTDQIPKTFREGDEHGAGKLAPQVQTEFAQRQRKVKDSPRGSDLKNEKDQSKGAAVTGRRPRKRSGSGDSLDVRG